MRTEIEHFVICKKKKWYVVLASVKERSYEIVTKIPASGKLNSVNETKLEGNFVYSRMCYSVFLVFCLKPIKVILSHRNVAEQRLRS
jgi:hypothetical protein